MKNYLDFIKESDDIEIWEEDNLEEYKDMIDRVFIRVSAPKQDDKKLLIRVGDVIKIDNIKKNKAGEDKFYVSNITSNVSRRYYLSMDTFKNYYEELTNKNQVSKNLLALIPALEYVKGFDYIKEEEDGENISFLQKNRESKTDDKWNGNNRTKIRIGRFLRRIFPHYIDVEIERLTNEVKTIARYKPENIISVSGEDIRHWYHCKNYTDENKGTLHNR